MHDGVVEQIGTPLELFDRPGKLFVAQFIGSPAMNVLDGVVRGDAVEAIGARWPMSQGTRVADGTAVHYGIRPTDLALSDRGIPATVVVVEPTGAETELLVRVGDRDLIVVAHGRVSLSPGDATCLAVAPDKAHVFDGRDGRRL
jgi:multiple sugar transport system ATP-binding protein